MSTRFDHRDPGTPEQRWLTSGLERLPRLEPPGAGTSLLVVAAHPDDETLGAGALMADAAARGAAVHVLVATDGEASHPGSPSHSPMLLAERRRREVTDAVAVVAPRASVEFLGLRDGDLGSDHALLVDAIRDRLRGRTVVVSPWRGDGHPDHEACARAAREAVSGSADGQHWQYPIWAWHWGAPDAADAPSQAPGAHRLDVSTAAARAKQAAIDCHVSQHAPLSAAEGDEAILPPHLLEHFRRDFEVFIVEPSDESARASRPEYFDALYAKTDDPWGIEDRFYERRKRNLLMASLPRERFSRAFEPGCATGRLTVELASRCDQVIAWDGAAAAVRQARERLSSETVTVEQRRIPEDWPDGEFDLIVVSEVGYFCTDLDLLARRVRTSLAADGVLVVCHWTRPALDNPHTAQQVHDAMGATLPRLARHREQDFLLDVWSVRDESVAAAEGIVQ